VTSRDLNPLDYRIWGMLQERVYRVPIRDTDELWQRLAATWAEFQQSMVDSAVGQWRKRLKACIRAEGAGHYEHFLWRCLPDIPFPVATHHSRSFQIDQCQPITGSFQRRQRLEVCNITFSQMKKFCILQGSVVTFFGCGG